MKLQGTWTRSKTEDMGETLDLLLNDKAKRRAFLTKLDHYIAELKRNGLSAHVLEHIQIKDRLLDAFANYDAVDCKSSAKNVANNVIQMKPPNTASIELVDMEEPVASVHCKSTARLDMAETRPNVGVKARGYK